MSKNANCRPRTAFELLNRVCKHILEEPKRYYQGMWGNTNEDLIKATVGSVPACGTMACRAGWIVALHDGMPAFHRMLNMDCLPGEVGVRAKEILGDLDTDSLFDEDAVNGFPGTVAYAEQGASGIEDFMAKHEEYLKARLLRKIRKC